MVTDALNAAIFFTIRYLLLPGVLVSTTADLSSEKNSRSCIDIRGKGTTLNNCTYHWPRVSCEMVTMATSNGTLTQVDLKQYLKYVLEFKIHGIMYENTHQDNLNSSNASEKNSSYQCLHLEKLRFTKEKTNDHNINSHASIEILPFPILLQLAGLDQLTIEFEFNSSKPLARTLVTNGSAIVKGVEMYSHINLTFQAAHYPSLKNIVEEKFGQFSQFQGIIRELHVVQSSNIDVKIWENIVCNNSIDLKVNGGRWTRLGKKHLPVMLFLKLLDLSNNRISEIEDDIFERTPNLQSLSLSNNNLSKLSSSIASLKNLQLLDLSRNPSLQIKKSNKVLRNLEKLLWLNLSYTTLKKLDSLRILYDKRNYSNLLSLQLRKCNLFITEHDVEFFDHMSFLIELDLSENQLSLLPPDLFRSLRNLKMLRLSSNRFTQIVDLNLKHSKHLDLLDLSNNKFVELKHVKIEGAFGEINLSGNAIKSWEQIHLYNIPDDLYEIEAKRLNLSYNSITNISEDMQRVFSVLNDVDLGGNPLNCSSCNTPLLQRWLLKNKTTTVLNLGSVQNLRCEDLEHGLTDVVEVNFNEGRCSLDIYDIDYALVVGVPLLVLAALVLLAAIAIYGYRYEITYIRHLVNIRRQKHLKETQSTERYKYDAFVSYSAADRDWVMRELQPHLEQGSERYRLCLHERDFALGSIIADNIVECMKDSRNTLVILTPHFVKSQWCRWELEVANHKLFEDDREFLILIELKKLDKKTLPRHLAYLVDTRTYLEWPKGHGAHTRAWARLKSALGESLYQRRMKQKTKTTDEPNTAEDKVDIVNIEV